MLTYSNFPNRLAEALALCQQQTQLFTLDPSCTLTPLTNGLSNQNYLFQTHDSSFVIRENSSHSNIICDRENEIKCWKTAAKIDLAPSLLWCSNDYNYYLSHYLPQPTITNVSPSTALELLNSLKQLQLPERSISSYQQWLIYHQQLEALFIELERNINEKHISSFNDWASLFKNIEKKQKLIQTWAIDVQSSTINQQFSHRDLNSDNLLIKEKKLVCIDFEYACAAEPIYDLVSLLEGISFSKIERQHITENYLNNNNNVEKRSIMAISSMAYLYQIFSDYWVALMAGSTLLEATKQEGLEVIAEFNRFMEHR